MYNIMYLDFNMRGGVGVCLQEYNLDIFNWHYSYSIDDFYEVLSMRGVYITTAVMETTSKGNTCIYTAVHTCTYIRTCVHTCTLYVHRTYIL